MEIKDVPIDKIKVIENTRLRIEETELSSLMEDIKQRGLLQPIGLIKLKGKNEYLVEYGNRRLAAFKKLEKKTIPSLIKEVKEIDFAKFLANNYAENAERENISPFELARLCEWYLNKNYSISEIAILLSEPKTKIIDSLRIIKSTPDEFKEKIAFTWGKTNKKGKIPITTAKRIHNSFKMKGGNQENIPKLYEYVKKLELTGSDIDIINNLCVTNKNLTIDEAVNLRHKFIVIRADLAIKRKIAEKYLKTMSKKEFIIECMKGNIPDSKELF